LSRRLFGRRRQADEALLGYRFGGVAGGMRNQMTPQMRQQLDDDDLWQMMQDGSLEER
jgi:hypothetical protein